MSLQPDDRDLYEGLMAARRAGRLTLKGQRMLRELRTKDLEGQVPATTLGQRVLIGAGKRAMDYARGAKQVGLQIGEATGLADPGTVADYMRQVDEELKLFGPLEELYPVSVGTGEFLGDVGVTAAVPTVGRTLGGRMGSAAAIEGGAGGVEYQPTGDLGLRAMSAMERGVGGIAGQGLAEGAGGIMRRAMGSPPPAGRGPLQVSPELESEVPMPATPPRRYGYWDEEFGIPYSEGLYTGNLARQKVEERMRHGAFGPKRQEELNNLLAFMRLRGEEAYQGFEAGVSRGTLQSAPEAGRELARNMREASDELWSSTGDAFRLAEANRSYLTPQDTQSVLGRLRNSLSQYDLISPEQTPATHELLGRLDTFMPQLEQGQELVGMDAKGLHALRMTINNLRDSAGNNLDRRNLRTLRQELDQAMLELADSGRLMGDPEGIRALQEGIRLRADYGRLYGPRLSRSRSGRLRTDSVGQKIEDLVEDKISPEDFMQWSFGKSKFDPGGKWADVADRVADVFGRDSTEYGLIQNIALERLRESVLNPNTGLISPSKLNTMWTAMKRNPERLARIVNPDQADTFDRLVKAFKRMDPQRDAVNFSNSAHTIEAALGDLARKTATATSAATGGLGAAVATHAGLSATEKLANTVKWMFGQRVFEPRALLHPKAGYVRAPTSAMIPPTTEEQEMEQIRTGPIPGM